MNDVLDDRIVETLARRAATVDGTSRVSADRVIGIGVRARRGHRAALAGAAVALAVVAGVAVATRHPGPALEPAHDHVGLGVLGFDVLDATRGVIATADGGRVQIASPDAGDVWRATRVPQGWVVEADRSYHDKTLLFVAADGTTTPITTYDLDGNYVISPNGQTLVVTQVRSDPSHASGARAVAYALPSLDRIAALTTYPADFSESVWVAGIADNQVLLVDDGHSTAGKLGGVWNTGTATLATLPVDTDSVLGMSDQGEVLHVRHTTDAQGDVTSSCVSVVALADLAGADEAPATCISDIDVASGAISPDGTLAFLQWGYPGPPLGMVRTADLAGGHAIPVEMSYDFTEYSAAGGYNQPWTSDDRVMLTAGGGDYAQFSYAACGLNGWCSIVTTPTDVAMPMIVWHPRS